MPFIVIGLGIAALLILIIRFKVPAFISLVIVAIGVGLAQGMEAVEVLKSLQNGTGGTLGYLALVLGFGAMLGGILAETGAAQRITQQLVAAFSTSKIQWAMVLTGFIVGIPMFYSVGFVMLIPLVFAIAKTSKLPILYLAIPMVAALSVTHGFLPPHPAPTTLAVIYEADMSITFLYGLILAVPTIVIAGPLFGSTLKNIKVNLPKNLFKLKEVDAQTPSFSSSLMTALVPVILMALSAILKLNLPENHDILPVVSFIGEPVMALLIALLVSMYTLGVRQGKSMGEISDICLQSVKGIAMILLIIGAGGGFKQILIDSGTSDTIINSLQGTEMSPIVLAWLIAAALRISLGSATVAALTAAGIASPLIASTNVSPELLVLATGAGSLTFSQVNDTGFWMFKEYFNLTIWQTFRTWTVMETIVSLIGLGGCLLLEIVV
ncbi:MAG: gluconate:H+ symporter [Bacteroidota bacterium]